MANLRADVFFFFTFLTALHPLDLLPFKAVAAHWVVSNPYFSTCVLRVWTLTDVPSGLQSSNFHKNGIPFLLRQFCCSCICMILFLVFIWDASLQMGSCVFPVPSLGEKTAVGARGCPGWPLRHGDADTPCGRPAAWMFPAAGRWLLSGRHLKRLQSPIFNVLIVYSRELEPVDGKGV